MSRKLNIQNTDYGSEGMIPQQVKTPEQVLKYVLLGSLPTPVIDLSGYESFSIQLNNGGSSSTSQLNIQGSNDNISWHNLQVDLLGQQAPLSKGTFRMSNLESCTYASNKTTRFIKISFVTGAAHTCIITLSGVVIQQKKADLYLYNDWSWRYVAPSSGINTTPVTIAAAQSPAFKNSLTNIQISNSGTAGTELQILDGSAGTCIWRTWVAPGSTISHKFDVPIIGSASNLLQAVLTVTVNVNIYLNAQGLIISA